MTSSSQNPTAVPLEESQDFGAAVISEGWTMAWARYHGQLTDRLDGDPSAATRRLCEAIWEHALPSGECLKVTTLGPWSWI